MFAKLVRVIGQEESSSLNDRDWWEGVIEGVKRCDKITDDQQEVLNELLEKIIEHNERKDFVPTTYVHAKGGNE